MIFTDFKEWAKTKVSALRGRGINASFTSLENIENPIAQIEGTWQN